MASIKQLLKQPIKVRVKLHNYRFPRSGVQEQGFAIISFDVLHVIDGELPDECRNDDGSYSIVAKGNMPKIDKKQEYILQGTLTFDKKWGVGCDTSFIRLDYNFKSTEDQKKFFSYFITERQLDLLFAQHDDPVKLLAEKNIGELIKIKGVGPATAVKMCNKYEQNKDYGRAYVELKEFGLTRKAIDKIVAAYGSPDLAAEKVNQNPYILIKHVRGFGWQKADTAARNKGFAKNSHERVIAYIQYFLQEQADSCGNVWVTLDELVTNIHAECDPLGQETLLSWIKEETASEEAFESFFMHSNYRNTDHPLMVYCKEGKKIGLFYYKMLEKTIAYELQRLQDAEPFYTFDEESVEKEIKKVEKEEGFTYTEEQHKAIREMLQSNVSVLTGSSGVGKTSTLKPLIRVLKKANIHIEQCALAGKASSLLGEVTGLQGKTIHRLLGYTPEAEIFTHTSSNPINAEVIILDETSMVGEELFLSLISAIRNGSKFIMLGDIKQLPPINVGNILSDCIRSGYIKANILTKIHRQALKSGIISQAIKVCAGESLVANDAIGEEVRGELRDFKIISSADARTIQYHIIDEFKKLYFDRKIPIDDIQIIVPIKTKGDNSCRAVNNIIQEIVNPGIQKKTAKVEYVENGQYYTVTYKVNDRIIINRNNYHARTLSGTQVAIFNGNMGKIIDIDDEVIVVELREQGKVILEKDDWWNIGLAYAVTVHKLQGSQSPYIIVVIDSSAYVLLSRELVYTAITRATKECILINQPRMLNQAVRISAIKQKQTWLRDELFSLYLENQAQEEDS